MAITCAAFAQFWIGNGDSFANNAIASAPSSHEKPILSLGSPLFSATSKGCLSRAAGARLGLQTDQTLEEEEAEQASTEPNHREWRQ